MNEPYENDIDPGPPIAELAGLREAPVPRFVERIRGSIHRRMVVAQSSDLAMPIFLRTLLEYVTMVFSVFESGSHESRTDLDRSDGASSPDRDSTNEPE